MGAAPPASQIATHALQAASSVPATLPTHWCGWGARGVGAAPPATQSTAPARRRQRPPRSARSRQRPPQGAKGRQEPPPGATRLRQSPPGAATSRQGQPGPARGGQPSEHTNRVKGLDFRVIIIMLTHECSKRSWAECRRRRTVRLNPHRSVDSSKRSVATPRQVRKRLMLIVGDACSSLGFLKGARAGCGHPEPRAFCLQSSRPKPPKMNHFRV